MKKIVKAIFIVSTIMVAALAGIMLYLNHLKGQYNNDEKQREYQELDIVTEEVPRTAFTEKDVITPLYLSGKNKNVFTFDDVPLSKVYTTAYTKSVDKKLLTEKKRGSRRIDNALWAWNPYGTQPMSLYVYFLTRTNSYLEYTISVEDEEIPDFTRTLNNHEEGNATLTQEYSIIGLIPGKKNYITLRLYREDGTLDKQKHYSIDVPETPKDIEHKITMTKGYNHLLLSSGLYAVYGNDRNKNTKPYILLYDNSGYLRGYVPLKAGAADHVEVLDGCLFFPCSRNQFALMSPTGQIRKMYTLGGYEIYAGFAYDGQNGVYVLADNKQKKTMHDGLIKLDLKHGEIEREYNLQEYLGNVKKRAQNNINEMGKTKKKAKGESKARKKAAKKNTAKSKKLNWLDLNSIQCIDKTSLILSSRELSSVLVLKKINKRTPVLKGIIGENIFWQGTGVGKKVAKKVGSFVSQFGQNAVTWGYSGEYQELSPEYDENGEIIQNDTTDTTLSKQYYIYLFNNNYGNSKTMSSVNYASYDAGTRKKKPSHSYFMTYLYDETKNMYRLDKKLEMPFSAEYGSVQQQPNGNTVIASPDNKVFMEYTSDSKMLHSYRMDGKFTKIEKRDFKDFWFQ